MKRFHLLKKKTSLLNYLLPGIGFSMTVFPTQTNSQPAIELFRVYDNGQMQFETLHDIFPSDDGGYFACGSSNSRLWALKVNENGAIVWDQMTGQGNNSRFQSIIQTDDGAVLLGGRSLNGMFYAALLNGDDGELIWDREYVSGTNRAVIELKSGEFVLAGYTSQGGWNGYITMVNPEDGEPIWEYFERRERSSKGFNAIREAEDGLVAVGEDRTIGVMTKLDFNGQAVWIRRHDFNEQSAWMTSLVSREGGYAIGGAGSRSGYYARLSLVSGDGAEANHIEFRPVFRISNLIWGIGRLSDGGFILDGMQSDSRDINNATDTFLMIRTDRNGELVWSTTFPELEYHLEPTQTSLYSVIVDDQDRIVACGSYTDPGGETGDDGVIIRLGPDLLGPIVFHKSPEDSLLSVLRGDTIQFIVRARNQRGVEMDYQWRFGEEELGNDTTETIEFNELGQFEVTCLVSDIDAEVLVGWQVNVTELYIESFEPDTLELSIRRNESLDFSVEVRALEGGPVNYEWTFDREIISEEPFAQVQFREIGDHPVHIVAFRDQAADSLQWLVHVRSTVRDFWPDELQFRAPVDTTILFGVEPFDPGEEEMLLMMMMDGDTVAVDTFETRVNFEEVGEYDLSYIVRIGEEADTIRWEVSVYDPLDVQRQAGMPVPLEYGLLPPSPNPFNSRVTLSFALPQPDHIRLVVFDISGRIVQEVVNGLYGRGGHDVIWNAVGVPAGIYFARLETASNAYFAKLVLVK